MNKDMKSKVSEARLQMQNPYAHIEYLEEMWSDENGQEKVLPGYQVSVKSNHSQPRRYKDSQIEAEAQGLLEHLWKNRSQIWGHATPTDPIGVIDPAMALKHIGYQFATVDELGDYIADSGVKVAGLIDNTAKTVKVSSRFPLNVQRFTAAHELGHAVLHNTGGTIHRDRSLDGTSIPRDSVERDADKFATCFLMPAKLVRARFVQMFGMEPFRLTQDSAFPLFEKTIFEARKECRSLRDLSLFLAKTGRYGGRDIISFADQFHVSGKAMAIRLEELGLVVFQ